MTPATMKPVTNPADTIPDRSIVFMANSLDFFYPIPGVRRVSIGLCEIKRT